MDNIIGGKIALFPVSGMTTGRICDIEPNKNSNFYVDMD
jgi:hypothetical protein